MLVILTGVVGSFASRAMPSYKPKSLPQISPAGHLLQRTVTRKALTTFQYKNIFRAGTAEVLGTELETMLLLLKSHDLSITGKVSVAKGEVPSKRRPALLAARLGTLSEALINFGLPAESITLSSSELPSEMQAVVSVYKMEAQKP